MNYLKPEQYKGQRYKYPYPSDEINPQLKRQKEYFLCVANSMMADYASNTCYVPFEFGSKRTFSELRAYATGQQSANKIKKSLIGEKRKKDGKFVTKMNVSFDTYYKLPQLFDIMREKNMRQEYDVEVNCIDEGSIAAKEAEKATLKFLLDESTKEFLNKAKYKPNFEVNPEQLGLMSESDVDMYFETGGYTLPRETACLAACKKTKMVSDYMVLQDATFDDLITNTQGLTGWKTYIDKSTMIPMIEKLDVEQCVIPFSKRNDFGDITRAGHLKYMTIADIRKSNPKFTSADLLYLAKQFSWLNPEYTSLLGNRGYYDRSYMSGMATDYDVDPVSRCKVLVLDHQWLSVDIETNLKNITGTGQVRYKPVAFDYVADEKSKKKGDKVIKKRVIKKYYSEWIVGTDMFVDYGVCKDVVYYGQDGNKTPKLDFFFVKTGNASLVERGIAIVDDIDMLLVKHRNTLATLPASPAMAIQKDLLENVMLNGILQQPDDIIQGLIERGVLYYNGLDDHGKPLYFAGGQKPIDFMDITKVAGMLSVISNEIAVKINELKEVLGLQNGADAGGSSPYQGLGQTQLAFQAANASLYPTFKAYNYLFKAAFTDIIKKWQIVAKDNDLKVSYSVLGTKNLAIFRLDKNFTEAEFNNDIVIAASQEEKQNLMMYIAQQRDLGTQTGGEQGLNASEFLYLYMKIMAGSIKEAYWVMAQIENKKQDEKRQEAIINQKMNIEDQQASAKMKADMDKQNIEAKGQQTINNTLVAQLLKQNSEMLQLLLAPKAVGEGQVNAPVITQTIQDNNQAVGAIVAPQPSPEEMAMAEQGQAMEQSVA